MAENKEELGAVLFDWKCIECHEWGQPPYDGVQRCTECQREYYTAKLILMARNIEKIQLQYQKRDNLLVGFVKRVINIVGCISKYFFYR